MFQKNSIVKNYHTGKFFWVKDVSLLPNGNTHLTAISLTAKHKVHKSTPVVKERVLVVEASNSRTLFYTTIKVNVPYESIIDNQG